MSARGTAAGGELESSKTSSHNDSWSILACALRPRLFPIRWHVDGRRDDGGLVVSHIDGNGRVVRPADYAAEHVSLAYAVTVHRAEGVTVDRAVLLADSATTSEHLYVGMTRGRHDNRVYVVTDAATTGHGYQIPPTPFELLAAAIRRSSAELSATETLRAELDRPMTVLTSRRASWSGFHGGPGFDRLPVDGRTAEWPAIDLTDPERWTPKRTSGGAAESSPPPVDRRTF